MPASRPNPRAAMNHERAGFKPEPSVTTKPSKAPLALPGPEPDREPARSQGRQDKPPGGRKRKPQSDHRLPASTKLEPAEMEKLDRIARSISRTDANRSAALRFLVQDFDESKL